MQLYHIISPQSLCFCARDDHKSLSLLEELNLPARRLLRRSGWLLISKTNKGCRVRTRVVMDGVSSDGASTRLFWFFVLLVGASGRGFSRRQRWRYFRFLPHSLRPTPQRRNQSQDQNRVWFLNIRDRLVSSSSSSSSLSAGERARVGDRGTRQTRDRIQFLATGRRGDRGLVRRRD